VNSKGRNSSGESENEDEDGDEGDEVDEDDGDEGDVEARDTVPPLMHDLKTNGSERSLAMAMAMGEGEGEGEGEETDKAKRPSPAGSPTTHALRRGRSASSLPHSEYSEGGSDTEDDFAYSQNFDQGTGVDEERRPHSAREHSAVYHEDFEGGTSFISETPRKGEEEEEEHEHTLHRDASVASYVSAIMDEAITSLLSPPRRGLLNTYSSIAQESVLLTAEQEEVGEEEGEEEGEVEEEGMELCRAPSSSLLEVQSQETREYKSIISFITNVINSSENGGQQQQQQQQRSGLENENENENDLGKHVSSSLFSQDRYEDDFTHEAKEATSKTAPTNSSILSANYTEDFVPTESVSIHLPLQRSKEGEVGDAVPYEDDFISDDGGEKGGETKKKGKGKGRGKGKKALTAAEVRSSEVWKLMASEAKLDIDLSDAKETRRNMSKIVRELLKSVETRRDTEKMDGGEVRSNNMKWFTQTAEEEEDREEDRKKRDREEASWEEGGRREEQEQSHICHFCGNVFYGECKPFIPSHHLHHIIYYR
jgi:hypothetical protein